MSMTPLEICAKGARMPAPTDGKLNDRQRKQILEALHAIKEVEGKNQTAMAQILRCSRAVWLRVSRGDYSGNSDRYLLRGRQWMADRKARSEIPLASYVKTSIGSRIMAVCTRAWQVPCIGKVITPSGSGKTAALQEFTRLRGDRALYLQVGEAFATRQGITMELADRLGIPVTSRSTSATLYRQIRGKLASFYNGGDADPFCLLIDEATTLRPRALNILRNLHDDPTVRCAVVLADTVRLEGELASRRGIAGGYEQLRSRLGAQYVRTACDAITAGDVRAVADSVLDSLGYARKLTADAYRELVAIAQEDGKLRNVVYRLHAVHDVAAGAKVDPVYTVAEIDYVAPLVGQPRRHEEMTVAWAAQKPTAKSAPRSPNSFRKVG